MYVKRNESFFSLNGFAHVNRSTYRQQGKETDLKK